MPLDSVATRLRQTLTAEGLPEPQSIDGIQIGDLPPVPSSVIRTHPHQPWSFAVGAADRGHRISRFEQIGAVERPVRRLISWREPAPSDLAEANLEGARLPEAGPVQRQPPQSALPSSLRSLNRHEPNGHRNRNAPWNAAPPRTTPE